MNEIRQILASIDFDEYFEKLEDAGVPEDLIGMIQDYITEAFVSSL